MEARTKLQNSSVEKQIVSERRWGNRRPSPRLAVYYWNGGTPKPHGIRDISASGVYLLTEESLFPGTILLLTMQREDLDESSADQWIAVHALVTRRDRDGVALSFVFPRNRDSRLSASDLANGATREEMARFISKLFEYDDCQVQTTSSVSDVGPAPLDPGSIPAGTEFARTRSKIKRTKVCVCNLTRKGLISLDMSIVDAVHEPLKSVADEMSHVSSSGFWLTPFRGLPSGGGFSRFDVIFLDDKYKIAACVEEFAVAESGSYRSEHRSALVVPSRTISSSQIQVGDQLRICGADSRANEFTDPLWSVTHITKRASFKGESSSCLREAPPSLIQPAAGRVEKGSRLEDNRTIPDWYNPSLKTRLLRWLFPNIKPPDRRRANRIPVPDLIAFHSTGGEPKPHKVGDVSTGGFYLLTDERWLPGTRIVMTLQRNTGARHDLLDWSRIESEVVRWGTDGVGFEFVAMNKPEILQGNEFERREFDQFLAGITARRRSEMHIAH